MLWCVQETKKLGQEAQVCFSTSPFFAHKTRFSFSRATPLCPHSRACGRAQVCEGCRHVLPTAARASAACCCAALAHDANGPPLQRTLPSGALSLGRPAGCLTSPARHCRWSSQTGGRRPSGARRRPAHASPPSDKHTRPRPAGYDPKLLLHTLTVAWGPQPTTRHTVTNTKFFSGFLRGLAVFRRGGVSKHAQKKKGGDATLFYSA